METAVWAAQVVALAVTANGDVTSAPSRGAATTMPDVNFALMDVDGVEHPVTANKIKRPVKLNKTRALGGSSMLFCFLAPGQVQAP